MGRMNINQYIEENKGWFYSKMHFEEDQKLNNTMRLEKEKKSDGHEKYHSPITFDDNDTNNRFKIWEGQKRFLNLLSTVENIVSANLISILENYNTIYRCGILFTTNVNIFFKNDNNAMDYLAPNITFVKLENSSIIKMNGIYGLPDLVVEVSSSKNNDNLSINEKFVIYEKLKIREFWVVNPYCPNDKQIGIYTLISDKYIRVQKSIIFKELIFPLNL